MKNEADYSKYEYPYSHLKKETDVTTYSQHDSLMTAVEFLQDKLSQVLDFDLLKLFEEAKEMEEKQLNKAWQDGAVTAQNDASKEIEKNYVARVR